jgi:hypothetical protein
LEALEFGQDFSGQKAKYLGMLLEDGLDGGPLLKHLSLDIFLMFVFHDGCIEQDEKKNGMEEVHRQNRLGPQPRLPLFFEGL